MATCTWCQLEMTTVPSCTVEALHQAGRRVGMIRHGAERDSWRSARCGDCGASRGGFHHPGCEAQECPVCGRQMLSCGCRFDEDAVVDDEPDDVDGNGCLTQRRRIAGCDVIVHLDDLPAKDCTIVRGIPCTTALRTVIDVAPEMTPCELRDVVADFLDRRLFTVAEAWDRLDEPDMVGRRGAELLRRVLPPRVR